MSISSGTKRSWKQIEVSALRPGDMLADFGRVHGVKTQDGKTQVIAGEREYYVSFPSDSLVQAFTEDAQ